jgi:hypothetical protein
MLTPPGNFRCIEWAVWAQDRTCSRVTVRHSRRQTGSGPSLKEGGTTLPEQSGAFPTRTRPERTQKMERTSVLGNGGSSDLDFSYVEKFAGERSHRLKRGRASVAHLGNPDMRATPGGAEFAAGRRDRCGSSRRHGRWCRCSVELQRSGNLRRWRDNARQNKMLSPA